jgi:hypothetical protein
LSQKRHCAADARVRSISTAATQVKIKTISDDRSVESIQWKSEFLNSLFLYLVVAARVFGHLCSAHVSVPALRKRLEPVSDDAQLDYTVLRQRYVFEKSIRELMTLITLSHDKDCASSACWPVKQRVFITFALSLRRNFN